MDDDDYDEEVLDCKVILFGESGPSKTRIINFVFNNLSSRVLSFYEYDKSVKFVLWDTLSRHDGISRIFYKGASAAVLVYDMTNRNTFEAIKNYWYKEIKEYAPKDISKKNLNLN